jgi:hypothetical protein
MKQPAQLGIIGITGGSILGWVALARSTGSGDLLNWEVLILMGALFFGLVMGLFTFLLGLVVYGKD